MVPVPLRAPLSFWDKGLIAGVVVMHVLLVIAPLDVLAPVSAHHIGSLIWHGHVPYRDFGFEYPPLAAVAFLLPGLAPAGIAKSVLALEAVGLELAVAWFVLRHHPGALRRYGLLSILVFPFLSGGFDAVPMAAIAISTALVIKGQSAGWWVAAFGVLAKLSPITIWVWARRPRRAAIVAGIVTAVLLCVPLLLSRDADSNYVGWSLHRGVEAESVAGSVAWLGHLVSHTPAHLVYRYRATEIAGATSVGLLLSAIAAVGVAVVAWRAERIDPWLASLAAVLLFLVGFKVLSPQYLAWGAPLAAVAGGRRYALYLTATALTTATYLIADDRNSLLGMTAVRNVVLVVLTIAVIRDVVGERIALQTYVRDVTPVL